MKKNNKGFTLMEMLIVVAIIAVLIAIAIPVFTAQLEKAREATDLANMRSAYAEVMVSAVSGEADTANGVTLTDGVFSKDYKLKQTESGWQTTGTLTVGDFDVSSLAVAKDATVTIKFTSSTSKLEIVVK